MQSTRTHVSEYKANLYTATIVGILIFGGIIVGGEMRIERRIAIIAKFICPVEQIPFMRQQEHFLASVGNNSAPASDFRNE